jgi:hypothetical protein
MNTSSDESIMPISVELSAEWLDRLMSNPQSVADIVCKERNIADKLTSDFSESLKKRLTHYPTLKATNYPRLKLTYNRNRTATTALVIKTVVYTGNDNFTEIILTRSESFTKAMEAKDYRRNKYHISGQCFAEICEVMEKRRKVL